MEAQLILGNQLFHPAKFLGHLDKKSIVFMREDPELCTHFKYHKHKIIFFLSAMRKYKVELQDAGFEVHYESLSQNQENKFEDALIHFLTSNKIDHLHIFEIEDKFFEERIMSCLSKAFIKTTVHRSPMFLTSRKQFKEYLGNTKKPFMKTFYEGQRKRMKILIDQNNNPIGGKWSFDEENRKKLPKNFIAPALPKFTADKIDLEVFNLVNLNFKDHPGHTSDYWLPTDRKNSYNWLKSFVLERLSNFGPFEDALSEKHDFINHSVLTPFLNTGLLTPDEIIIAVINEAKKQQYPINSVEGFIRQIIGWREFIRGIYQNYSEIQDTSNFWNHHRKLNDKWYTGDTGIAPLDHVIKKASKIGYAHHIERLMVVGSLMLLLEVHPQEAHRWFMEMFIDSSDWVMGPNVYGMTLHSDGGIFSTKPYFCGSNYYKKMGDFKGGEWEIAVDGLYWMFIEKNKSFFNKNPRTSFMSKNLEKISKERKEQMFQAAEAIKKLLTEPI